MTRALFEFHANSLPTGSRARRPPSRATSSATRFASSSGSAQPVGQGDELAGTRRACARPRPVGARTGRLAHEDGRCRDPRPASRRDGGRHSASFSIPVPPELHRRWTASGVFPRIDPELIEIAQAKAGVTIAGETPIDPATVRAALDGAREVLWRTQRPDGSWESLCDMGAIPTAQVLVALHAAGALDPSDAADGARWLRGRQAQDGSYRSHPTATEGDLGATASAWAALRVCAPDDSAEAIARAAAWVEAHGGTAAVVEAFGRGDPAVVYVALAGLIEPSQLPCPPMLPALIRPAVRFMERRFPLGDPDGERSADPDRAPAARDGAHPPCHPPSHPPCHPPSPSPSRRSPVRPDRAAVCGPHAHAARDLSEPRRQLEREHDPDRAHPARASRCWGCRAATRWWRAPWPGSRASASATLTACTSRRSAVLCGAPRGTCAR